MWKLCDALVELEKEAAKECDSNSRRHLINAHKLRKAGEGNIMRWLVGLSCCDAVVFRKGRRPHCGKLTAAS
jgi:hypothetical protein